MTQKSSDHLFESLSALVDGEVSELELHRLLRTIGDDKALQLRWHRYNLMRSVLRGEPATPSLGFDTNMLAAVRQRLAQEHTPKATESIVDQTSSIASSAAEVSISEPRLAWQVWLGKSAVAASVAVAFVFGLGQWSQLSSSAAPSAVLAASAQGGKAGSAEMELANAPTVGAPLGFELPALESRNVSIASQYNFSPAPVMVRNPLVGVDGLSSPQAQQLLNQLHILHAERASANGGLGLLPFARISDMDATAEQR